MHKELLTTSPLVGLSIVALFLFLTVFVAAAIRVMTRSRADIEEAARLPLHPEGENRHG